jgi:hypothetical protein
VNNQKFKNGYATKNSLGGLEYQEIVNRLEKDGDKICLSAVRSNFLKGLAKIAREVCIVQGVPANKLNEEVDRIILDPRFQESISSTMSEMSAGGV